MVDPEVTRKQWEKVATYILYGLIAGAAYLSYTFIATAVTSMLMWIAFAAVVYVAITMAPVFATYVANKKVQALVAVIEANPIETMQNLLVEKQEIWNRQDDAIRDFDTEYRNVNSLVEDLKKSDPEEAAQYSEMRDQMKVGLEELREEQTLASDALKFFKSQIDKARRIWKVAQAMNKALEKSQSAQAQVFAQIKEQVAFDKVRTDLNRAFANLNSAVERRKNASMFKPKELPAKVEVVDITDDNYATKSKVKIAR